MKIVEVRSMQPVAPNSPPDWRTSLGQILVAVDTDAGLTGYGVGGGGLAGVHVVRTVLRDLLLGRDPAPVERIWDEMYAATLAFGRKGLAVMALSGVDLALWDLRGKTERRAVVELLGGKAGAAIPTYATFWDEIPPTALGKHRGYKLHLGERDAADRVALVERGVRAARSAVGPGVPLMVDAWMKWDVPTTLAVADAVVGYDVGWIEEPLSPDDLAGYELLRDRCRVPIAGGEHEFTAIGFAPLIDRRLHTVLQPDVCWCGGMTELVKIYRAAQSAGLRVCPHRGAELWGLHALAALDPDPLAETGRPWMTWVGGQPAVGEDGCVQVTDAPGFGVVIDEDRLQTL